MEFGAAGLDSLSDARDLVCCEIVHRKDVAGPECRHKDLRHVSLAKVVDLI